GSQRNPTLFETGETLPSFARLGRTNASVPTRARAKAAESLESGVSGAWVSSAQRYSHAALAIDASGRGPVHFIGADHAVSATGEFIADAAILIGVVADLQYHTRLQDKDRDAWPRAAAARCTLGDVAGVGELRNLLSHWLFAGCDAYVAHCQLRNRGVPLSGAGALVRVLVIGVIFHPRAAEEMPVGAVGRLNLRNLHIIHQAQRELAFALERRSWPSRRQHDDFPRPERRQHPFDDVAPGVPFAPDVAILIDLVAARRDHLGVQRHIALRHADAIELQLHVALAPEMSGVLGRFQMSDQVAAARESLLAEFGHRVEMTEDGISDGNGCRRKVRFIHGALQKSTGGQDHLPRTGT